MDGVIRDELTGEERRARERARRIEQGIAWGMPATLEWVKEEEAWEEDTPEEEAEDIRISKERSAAPNPLLLRDWLQEMDEQYPEDVEFFSKLDEHFPDGHDWVFELNPESDAGAKFFRKLQADFPDAAAFFLLDD